MEKIQLHLYKYEDSQFKQVAIIDDYQEYSFEHNLYQAGQFTVTINFNIPNARLFERGLFIKFGEDKYCFGEILTINDAVGSDGKGSQLRNIMGFDIRYLLKRRVIKNMNNGGTWVKTDKGEICLRNLINDQCGENAENKRKLPIINTIPLPANAIGKEYSVSEEFSNLYEVCKTIATQSEFGWRIKFENGLLTLECFEGNDLRNSVFFSPDFDSLASGNLSDSNNSYSNAIYVAGKGQNEERDLYEGETVENDITPEGMGRFESFDNQSQMTTEDEYKAEAFSMLAQYGQTLEMTGQGLIKCPYVFKEQYNIGDKITLLFNDKKSVVQILSVTERSVKGTYSLNFNFGKPENTLKDQLQIILRKLQMANNKGSAVDCVKWYTIPTDSEMNKADVTFNTIGFTGNNSNQDFTFTLYTDDEKTGSKNYMVYIKNLVGTGKLILTTGKEDAQNLSLLGGTYIADIFVDEDGNVKLNSATPTTVIEADNPMPATSGAVYEAIQQGGSGFGIPLGTWLAFENDSAPNIEWIRAGTTFDVNAYPALAMYLGSDKVPEMFDHNRLGEYEDFTISTNSSSPTVAPYDGVLHYIGSVGSVSNNIIYINNIPIIAASFWSGSGYHYAFTSGDIEIKKGDLLYSNSGAGWAVRQVAFYKHPLFIKATPTSTDSDYEGTLNAIRQYADSKVSYSTEEVETGGIWIDGKKIYKKTLTTTNKGTSSGFTFDQTILNVDTIIKAEGFIKCSSGTYNGMQFQIPRGNEELNFTNSTGVMTLGGRSTAVNTDYAQITVEYTKTTD